MNDMNQEKMADLQSSIMPVKVEVQYVTSADNVPDKLLIQKWVEAASHGVLKRSAEVLVRLVDAQESQALNNHYRSKNKPTNVLSFCSDIPDYIDSNEIGDIVICAEIVKQEAQQQNKQLMAHWAHMIVHGVLHLNGYDHQHTKEAEKMEQIEIQILAKLGFPNPYKDSRPDLISDSKET